MVSAVALRAAGGEAALRPGPDPISQRRIARSPPSSILPRPNGHDRGILRIRQRPVRFRLCSEPRPRGGSCGQLRAKTLLTQLPSVLTLGVTDACAPRRQGGGRRRSQKPDSKVVLSAGGASISSSIDPQAIRSPIGKCDRRVYTPLHQPDLLRAFFDASSQLPDVMVTRGPRLGSTLVHTVASHHITC